MKRVSHPSVVDLFRPDNERYKMIPEAPPPQPPCQPSRADRLSLKLLLLLLGQQWKHFTGAVNLLARFSLWYLLSPLLPPPPSTYISPFRLREAPQSLKDISGSREEIRQIKTRKSSFFSPRIYKFVHISFQLRASALRKAWGKSPRCCRFQSICFVSHGFPFFLKLPGHLVLAWVTLRSNCTFTSHLHKSFFSCSLTHEVQGTLQNTKWCDNRNV